MASEYPQHTQSPDLEQGVIHAIPLEDRLRIALDIPWPVIDFMKGLVVSTRRIVRISIKSINDEIADREASVERERQSLERAERRRTIHRFGSNWASELRKRTANSELERDILRDIVRRHPGQNVLSVRAIVRDHKHRVKARLNLRRDQLLIKLAVAGATNVEIGKRLGVSPQYAGRLVKNAFSTTTSQHLQGRN